MGGLASNVSLRSRTRVTTLTSITALVLALALSTVGVAHADRFGPPWQTQVIGNNVGVSAQPGGSSSTSKLDQGSMVVVLGTTTAADGTSWTQVSGGYVPASQVKESSDSWVAEVLAESVSATAYPDSKAAIHRTANRGDLLRVVGVSAGLNGDPNVYWATTEGYVPVGTLRATQSSWAQQWTLPDSSAAPQGWWGTIVSGANVRAGPTTQAPIVGSLVVGDNVKVLEEKTGENVQGSATWDRIDGGRYAGAWVHGSLIQRNANPKPNTTAPLSGTPANGTWIVVDRGASTLTLVKNGQPAFVTYVSLGVAQRQTPDGFYSTFETFAADRMTSRSVPDATHPYDLPNVPFTQYFSADGSAIHGTYWHDRFGTAVSQGCINLTWTDAAYLFGQTLPKVASNQESQTADPQQSTPVVVTN